MDIINNEENEENKLKVYYIYGPTGSGKTLKALDIMKENGYDEFDDIKYVNGYYIGNSTGTGCCLYDNFWKNDMNIIEFINFINCNGYNLKIKGGYLKNNYELIIITSIFSPFNIYNNCNNEIKNKLLNRMKIINIKDY